DTDTDTDTDSDTDTDTDTDACSATIASVDPADGATGVATDSVVTVTFSDAVTEADYSIKITGVPGASALAGDGLAATFTPDAKLDKDTDYSVVAKACSDTSDTTFHTAAPSKGVDPTKLPDQVYAIDYQNGIKDGTVTWKQPKSASYFDSQISIQYILIQVDSV